jgi:hypothetical protein
MKKIFLMGAITLLASTIISCNADEIDTENNTSPTTFHENLNQTNEKLQSNIDDGPGDEPVVIYPPKKG